MVNIALAASNIPDGATEEDLKTVYGPVVGFIKNQYKSILGRELELPDTPEGIIKAVRRIVLSLPEMYKIPLRRIEEYNRRARMILMAA